MSNELYAAGFGALIGAIISGFGAFFLANYQDNKLNNNRKNLFIIVIIDNLKASLPIFKQLTETWGKSEIILFEHTIELKELRKIYNKYIENIIYFPDELRKQIYDYYIKTDKLIIILESFQNRRHYLVNQYQEKLKEIITKKPGIDGKTLDIEALSFMQPENHEYKILKDEIEKKLNELEVYHLHAIKIIEKLNKLAT